MGLFSREAAICSVCGEECDFPKYRLADNLWLCQDCLKDAGISDTSALKNMTKKDIQERISNSASYDAMARKMYKYAVDNGFGRGWNKTWGVKHFRVIAEKLLSGEEFMMAFIGLHNYVSATKHDQNYAYAITNKRILMGQKLKIAGENFQAIYLDNINDITFSSGLILGVLTIDTIKEVFNVGLDKNSAKEISAKVLQVFHDLRAQKEPAQTVQESAPAFSAADEILKFKQLLDAGVLTQEEFDAKKKQLLGL